MSDRKDGGPVARPILMNGDMVRAVLEGRKTQTRRVVKPTGKHWKYDEEERDENGRVTYSGDTWIDESECPYGQPGGLLYVRETFGDAGVRLTYQADDDGAHCMIKKWTPSIHMPRWASRITLEITDVRVERLQDISEEDVDAECFGGDFPCSVLPDLFPGNPEQWAHLSMKECFARLWQSIYGAESWDANPWVWVVEFQPHMKNVDALLSEREGGGV
jgi:hypothetical protein